MRKLRAQKIEIDLPTETAPIWLHAVLQRVIKDDETYETKQIIDLVGHINREASKVATELITLTDPVTQQEVTLSGYGVNLAIKNFIVKWIAEEFEGHVNEVGDFIED